MAAVSEIGQKTEEHRTIWWRMYVLITTSSTYGLKYEYKILLQRSRLEKFAYSKCLFGHIISRESI